MTSTTADTHSDSKLSTASGTLGVLSGIGILTVALAPLAIPFLVLTAVFLAPLALPVLLVVPFALIVIAVRAVRRLVARPRRSAQSRQAHRRVHASSRAG
jgi:membrane protein implicated in regulation of membrane protease activity